jgi:small subunit ribosomal protein S20
LPKASGLPYNFRFPSKVLGVTVANTVQAAKRARQALKRRAHNFGMRTALRTAIKKVKKAIAAGDKTAAAQVLQSSTSTIDKLADKKIIHKNKAARHKSRLAAAIKQMA